MRCGIRTAPLPWEGEPGESILWTAAGRGWNRTQRHHMVMMKPTMMNAKAMTRFQKLMFGIG